MALTVAAFGLRLAGIDESVFGDELFTIHITAAPDLLDVVERVKAPATEVSPPLFFLVASIARRLGNPDYTWIRVPSLILGTATIPLVYALGTRLLECWAAVVGAALYALMPFAIFYSTEARPYATLAFLVVLSTTALLSALQGPGPFWWIVYGLATCAALYVHYTGVFVLGAQVLWAVAAYPTRRIAILASTGAAALCYVPWLPHLSGKGTVGIAYVGHPTLETVSKATLRAFPGSPYVATEVLPGTAAIAVLGTCLAVAAVLALSPLAARNELPPRSALVLIVVLVAATPIGLLAYSFASGNGIFLARNLTASLPAGVLLVALLLTTPRGIAGIALSLAALCAVGVGTLMTLDPDTQRPPIEDAARYIDLHAKPGEPVVDVAYHPSSSPLGHRLQLYFRRPHRVYQAGEDDAAAWRLAADGRRVFLVAERIGVLREIPRQVGPRNRFALRGQSPTYPGHTPVVVLVYRAVRPGAGGCPRRLTLEGGAFTQAARARRGRQSYG